MDAVALDNGLSKLVIEEDSGSGVGREPDVKLDGSVVCGAEAFGERLQ